MYVLIGEKNTLCTYYFYSYNEYGDYAPYFFPTDLGGMTDFQTIKNGEKLLAPHDPTHPSNTSAVFRGWYEGNTESGSLQLSEKPFAFNEAQKIGATDLRVVYLYAVFSDVVCVNLHGQYDAETDSYPIVETITESLAQGQTAVSVDIDDYTVGYYSTQNGAFPKYQFYGWSEIALPNPGEGENQKKSSPMEAVGTVDLYPIYQEIRWLSYNSGNSGTGASYFAPVSFPADEGIKEPLKVPQRQGYTFDGWYLKVEDEGTDAQNGTGLQLTDHEGRFKGDLTAAQLADHGLNIATDPETGTKTLYMLGDKEIYARWNISTANYTISSGAET